jgi:hypothetical protein
MTPADLYRTCSASAWRVETLQHYTGTADEERQRAFHAGEPLPPPGPGKLASLALISRLRRAGREVGRVHVVSRPLSAYVRYELAAYAENEAAGEAIRIADKSLHPGLGSIAQDFAIFDEGTPQATVILFDYDDAGLVRGYRVTDDPEAVERCRRQRDLALARSVPLADFTAASLDAAR